MEITLQLHLNLSKYMQGSIDGKTMRVKLSDEATVGDLLKKVNIPEAEIGLIVVNFSTTTIMDKLMPNDQVDFYPPIEGG